MSSDETQFQKLIEGLAASCHGSAELGRIRSFFEQTLKRTAECEKFLLPRLMQGAILWEAIKETVWEAPAKQEENRFSFLQGDVIETTMVSVLGRAPSSQVHSLWLVLSPDCDCVRAPYVRVARVFAVSRR